MKLLRAFFLFFLYALLPGAAGATHIVGGEINYEYLGNDTYKITLIVYRDCYYGVPPFDPVASIGVFNSSNVLLYDLRVDVNADSVLIPPVVSTNCLPPPVDICYRKATYDTILQLPAIVGGYQLAYQRCCRNATLDNIVAPDAQGITIYATIPGSEKFPNNSNPVIKQLPAPFICEDVYLEFDNSATDADGDSLFYEICTPFNGADQGNPNPQPPGTPPYLNVVWAPGFNLQNVMGGVPLTINPFTGKLTATPDNQGQYVYSVCIKEYRNGILLGATKRDFQFNVTPCPNITIASISGDDILCQNNTTVQFSNVSYNATGFFWNFGDNSTLADTSILQNPVYTFPSAGAFLVTLIAFNNNPACNDTVTKLVTLVGEYNVDFNYTVDTCTGKVTFTQFELTNQTTVNHQWNFGDNQSGSGNNLMHAYQADGNYVVTGYFVSDKGCRDTVIKTINIPYPILDVTAAANPLLVQSGDPVSLIASSSSASSYAWQPAAGISNPNLPTVLVVPGQTTTYTVYVINSIGCTDTASITVKVFGDECEEPYIFIPNAFSPNGDGENDTLYVRSQVLEMLTMTIYDRWGQKVFETNRIEVGWDGTHKGTPLATGVFDYYIEAVCLNNKTFIRKGNITLVR